MIERKYDKYFVSYERSRQMMEKGRTEDIAALNGSMLEGSYAYYASWFTPNTYLGCDNSKYVWWHGHPPHVHKEAEILFHIGTNPNDPTELGAEVVLYMGPELERHVITRSTVVYIPPGFVHCPWLPARTWKPWIHVEIHQSPMPSEKRMWQILPEEIVAQMDKESFLDRLY